MKTSPTSNNLISIVIIYKPNLFELKKIIYRHSINFKNTLLINNSPEINILIILFLHKLKLLIMIAILDYQRL